MTFSFPRWTRTLLLLLCVGAILHAADTPKVDDKDKPFLGVDIDTAATAFNGKGLAILRVEPRSTAAVMGITIGDRILQMDGTVLASVDDLAKAMSTHKPGDLVKLEIQREKGKDNLPEILKLSGVLQDTPKSKHASIYDQLAENARRIADLDKNKGPTLGEVLQKVADIEKDLPRAAEEFKKTYPNGEFKIVISVEITSDKTAKDPMLIENGKPLEAPKSNEEPKKPDEKK